MPPGKAATEARSRLNIAKEQANREDFNVLGITIPESNNQNWEQYSVELIQQGLLSLADQASGGIRHEQRRTDIQIRIAGEYLLLYQAFNDVNDPDRTIRQEIQQSILSVAGRTAQPAVQTAILTKLLVYIAGQLQTEADRANGQQLWQQTLDSCRKITEPLHERAALLAQTIAAKNLLENPNLQRRTFPLFTRETNASAFEESNRLIEEECLQLINSLEEEQQSRVCVYLAGTLAQIGRMRSAQRLLDNALDVTANISDREEAISILLSMVPTLKAMNSADIIPVVYRLAIDRVAHEFTDKAVNVDVYDWRLRDSDIELIVRSQMEHGFVDDAVESANRLNEPLLRDRLLRTAAYIYLDHENMDRAELTARRLTGREIQNDVLQNIQTVKRRPVIRPLTQNAEEQSANP
jgi:hypothetical protein